MTPAAPAPAPVVWTGNPLRDLPGWYAREGDPHAAFHLGTSDEHGRYGGPVNLAQARAWYAQAAEAGHADATYNLGTFVESGKGGPKDAMVAKALFMLANTRGTTRQIADLRIKPQDQGPVRAVVTALREPGRLRVHVWSGEVTIDLFEGASADLTRQLAARFGPRQALPDWALGGAIVGLKQGEASFERLEALIEAGAASSGLWCEDWVGIRETSFGRRLFWDWQWNADRYPDLPARIASLKARGIRFLGYVNPYLAVDGPLYPEAAAQGFFAKRLDSDAPYLVDFGEFDAGVVDFTNPDAATWFAERIIGREMLDVGLVGWMAGRLCGALGHREPI